MSSTTLQISSKLESFLQGTKKLYINGQFVTSHDNKTFSTPNPATGETLIDVYEAGAADIDEAVKAAKKAFHGPWRSMSAAERARLMFKAADLMEEHQEELARWKHLTMENQLMKQPMRISLLPLSTCAIMQGGPRK